MIQNKLDKYEAYVAVQESGAYNMLDPRARDLANEMSDYEITREDWVFIIRNYELLRDEYEHGLTSYCCGADILNENDGIGLCGDCKEWTEPAEYQYK